MCNLDVGQAREGPLNLFNVANPDIFKVRHVERTEFQKVLVWKRVLGQLREKMCKNRRIGVGNQLLDMGFSLYSPSNYSKTLDSETPIPFTLSFLPRIFFSGNPKAF